METEYFSGSRKARPWRRVEHYWLCDSCSSFVTLTFDQSRGLITVPLPDGMGRKTVKMVSMDTPMGMNRLDDEPARQTLNEVQK